MRRHQILHSSITYRRVYCITPYSTGVLPLYQALHLLWKYVPTGLIGNAFPRSRSLFYPLNGWSFYLGFEDKGSSPQQPVYGIDAIHKWKNGIIIIVCFVLRAHSTVCLVVATTTRSDLLTIPAFLWRYDDEGGGDKMLDFPSWSSGEAATIVIRATVAGKMFCVWVGVWSEADCINLLSRRVGKQTRAEHDAEQCLVEKKKREEIHANYYVWLEMLFNVEFIWNILYAYYYVLVANAIINVINSNDTTHKELYNAK